MTSLPLAQGSSLPGRCGRRHRCCTSLTLGKPPERNGSLVELKLQASDGFVEHLFFSASANVRSCMRAGQTELRRDRLSAGRGSILLAKLRGADDLGFETGN